jgi:X-Pro dipeptidyl-peptidase
MRAIAFILLVPLLAGCLGAGDDGQESIKQASDLAPFLNYTPDAPDASLDIEQTSFTVPGAPSLYVRVVKPAGDGPFPVIAQFTPYTAPGTNADLSQLIEPAAGEPAGRFDSEFVRRGYAFAYADVRGTGDSAGCLDLRGQLDIADVGRLTEWLGTQTWSNGNVGFIGASYPGSEAHMAGIANNEHLKAIVPVVASTSFYNYHHNSGVPYDGNHALGGTNFGYTQEGITPTMNPATYAQKASEQPLCPHAENMVNHGGLDQSGEFYAWWQERDIQPLVGEVKVPVLMAQGLADWNVKPNHIATWFNDLAPNGSKTLIGGQWGHAYPSDADEAYGVWWEYVTAFFDTFLKEIDTGMFETDVAWTQDNAGTWHRSATWPIQEAPVLQMYLQPNGTIGNVAASDGAASWHGCGRDQMNMGAAGVEIVEETLSQCANTNLVFETEPFAAPTNLQGTPVVYLNLEVDAETTHIVVVMDQIDANGNVVVSRENYGYLNPIYRDGLLNPQPLNGTTHLAIDLYPQEDFIPAGNSLRFTIGSIDGGRSIEFFPEGDNTIHWPGENRIELPIRPADQLGTRLQP